MNLRDLRRRPADVEEAARLTGAIGLTNTLTAAEAAPVAARLAARSRLELARLALAHPAMPWLERLAAEYDVCCFSFDAALRPAAGAEGTVGWLRQRPADGAASQVGSAIAEAVARHAGQPLGGVVVLSDFAWTGGRDPAEVARELKARHVPVFPVGLGVSAQPDYSVRRIIAPEVAFVGDQVPLRVQVDASGFDGQAGELTLRVNGAVAASRKLVFAGGAQFEEILYQPPPPAGNVALEVTVSGPPGEVSADNDRATHALKVLDEKIHVLYVEGLPRWEYRYLRWVLLRDPRLDVQFLMTEGDPLLASTQPRQLAQFPADPAAIMKYDLVILGDVPAKYFNATQLARLEELVRQGGGSLLMLAGPVGAPVSYWSTPLAKVLPVKFVNEPWRPVADDRHPVVTPAGLDSPCTALVGPAAANARLWARVRPLAHVPPLEDAKPGATTLLTLSGEPDGARAYPLVAWQRYGNGKAMFVGCEDLWRLRLEEGATYHARFWGQTIQFLALSRLLGANKQIALETDRRRYSAGEQIKIFANVLSETFEPVTDPVFKVLLAPAGQTQPPLELELEPVPNAPGLYAGLHLAAEDGAFVLQPLPRYRPQANLAEFEVRTTPVEQREADLQANVVRQLAELSGGRACRASELGQLPGWLHREDALTQTIHRERDLWDLPLLFVLLVVITGVEWFLRRRDNLV